MVRELRLAQAALVRKLMISLSKLAGPAPNPEGNNQIASQAGPGSFGKEIVDFLTLVEPERRTQNAGSGMQITFFQNALSKRSRIARVMSKLPQNATAERNFRTQFRNATI